ncbi:tRNA glutamyl-Q(34) synthetase GluQRS [Methylophaga sp.]|uniref:tRNA glutamyl-Q(34) synthetase GluQRS n=1 Tax=Methylophaga sp. TaxID=2024840 RepID=UPI003F69CBAD
MTNDSRLYVGRFAPSPTGPLHFGSLVAAVASYLDARSNEGSWLIRMEDLDKPREMPGAADDILRTLTAFGFEWDGEVVYQSQRYEAYQASLDKLISRDRVYTCSCSRREIAAIAHAGIEGPVYPGTCRSGMRQTEKAQAWRIKASASHVIFNDFFQGNIDHQMKLDIGDFILKRADGLFAYQLAVVVDDAETGITNVVRGVDLLNSTSRHILLQYLLTLPSPQYAHIPVVTNAQGKKLSKQTHAEPVHVKHAGHYLIDAFHFLGIDTSYYSASESLPALWKQAVKDWRLFAVPFKAN